MAITAQLVKELREMTGVGMMECKKALVAADGDINLAAEELRKAGQAKAVKKGGRVAAEGLIAITTSTDNKKAAILEVNSETDFVARQEDFIDFTKSLSALCLENNLNDVANIAEMKYTDAQTVEEKRLELIAKIGENISIRRVRTVELADGVAGVYQHAGSRIGAVVAINTNDTELATDLAMQVAAMNPEYVAAENVDADRIAKEKEIFMAQASEQHANKPQDIVEKIIAGQVNKVVEGLTLTGQPFVKDQNMKVGQLLKEKNTTVTEMIRFEVGEGISKEETDFVQEVMSQVKG